MSTKTKQTIPEWQLNLNLLELYTQENCDFCNEIKNKLKELNINFEEKPINKFNKKFTEIVKLTGLNHVPIVQYKDNYFVPGRDYTNPLDLISLLQTFEKCNFPIGIQNKEAIKTLNYNTLLAFKNTDEILKRIEEILQKINTDEHKSTD